VTASVTKVKAGRTIAVDPTIIPYGAVVEIEGLGTYIAEDCGSAIEGYDIDVYVESLSDIPEEGRQQLRARVIG
jgi:3D (Asp-Asp-Asp) domain-containing protein